MIRKKKSKILIKNNAILLLKSVEKIQKVKTKKL